MAKVFIIAGSLEEKKKKKEKHWEINVFVLIHVVHIIHGLYPCLLLT